MYYLEMDVLSRPCCNKKISLQNKDIHTLTFSSAWATKDWPPRTANNNDMRSEGVLESDENFAD